METTLPTELQEVFSRFITTEYTTIDRRGQPITWPVTPYYEPGDDHIDITTGLGYPKKADDAAANPKVSLLFSDPTGCGLSDPPSVLVQGTAAVISKLPKTRSGKILRGTIRKIADGAQWTMPPTIEDPATIDGIRSAVRSGRRSAVEVCHEALAQLDRVEPSLHAFNTVTRAQPAN